MTQRIKLVVAATAFYLLGLGTTSAMAQGGLTLEGLAEKFANLTGRVDSIEERLAALEATPTSTPRANTVTIAKTSNVRSGPGTHYPVVGQSAAGAVYEATGKNASRDWYRIDYKGQAAWVWTGLTDDRNLAVPVVETPMPPARPTPAASPTPQATRRSVALPPAAPAHDVQRVVIAKTRQSYWAAPSSTDWQGTIVPGPGKYAVPPGEYIYICTKTLNPYWHKIRVPAAPDGWVWIRAAIHFLDVVFCDQ